jgi:Protein of unknown function (DUF4230)
MTGRSPVAAFLLGVLAATALAFGGWLILSRSGLTIDLSRPAVVQRIQRLQRLETVVYSMEKIVTGAQENKFLPRMLAGERILLIVHGEVVAGIDLAKLDDSKITVNGRSIEVEMPAAELFSTRIDNQRTRVYSRETGLFTAPDPNLESEVRREAERQVQQSAIEGGILKTATENGRANLTGLLEGLGFESVIIR